MTLAEASEGKWSLSGRPALRGSLRPPGDKSISHRAAMLGALATGETMVEGWLAAADCLNTVEALRRLGVAIEIEGEFRDVLRVTGRGLRGLSPPQGNEPLDCGNSGTTMRLMLGILAAHPFKTRLAGDASLARRPMRRIVEPLRAMGAMIEGEQGGEFAPLSVEGADLRGADFDLPIASAQVKSSILLAGLQASGVTRVREPAQSRDHTERQLARLGASYSREGDGWHRVEGGTQFCAKPMRVPGDFSAAAYFLAGAALCPRSEVELTGVGINHTRAGFLEVLRKMGARVAVTNERDVDGEPVADLVVKGGGTLRGVRVAGELIPRMLDEIPLLAVLACYAEGITVIRDASELRVKESDRIVTIAEELTRMGGKVGVLPDGLAIEGGTGLSGGDVNSRGDHRIAKALAVGALGASGRTNVEGTSCVATSYPGFYADLKELGGAQ